jgi:hypothetical protein
VNFDLALRILGLSLSVGGLFAAGFQRKKLLAILLAALLITTLLTVAVYLKHDHEVRQVETELKGRLSNNRWTFEQIMSQMHDPDPNLILEQRIKVSKGGAWGKSANIRRRRPSYLLALFGHSWPPSEGDHSHAPVMPHLRV